MFDLLSGRAFSLIIRFSFVGRVHVLPIASAPRDASSSPEGPVPLEPHASYKLRAQSVMPTATVSMHHGLSSPAPEHRIPAVLAEDYQRQLVISSFRLALEIVALASLLVDIQGLLTTSHTSLCTPGHA